MGLFDIFKKKNTETTEKVGGMEDFMTLIRVYYESVMACNLGITNLAFLPDVAVFKTYPESAYAKQQTGRCRKEPQQKDAKRNLRPERRLLQGNRPDLSKKIAATSMR